MEIEISKILTDLESFSPVTGSVAQYGENAAAYTWSNALDFVKLNEIFEPSQDDYVREFFQSFGAWSKEELLKMPHLELQAMLLQHIVLEFEDNGEDFATDSDGRVWFYVGH